RHLDEAPGSWALPEIFTHVESAPDNLLNEINALRNIGNKQRGILGLPVDGGIPDGGIPISNNNARQLIESRGTPSEYARQQVESFNGQIVATQGKKGDQFVITEGTPNSGSGTYVTRVSAGHSPVDRVEQL